MVITMKKILIFLLILSLLTVPLLSCAGPGNPAEETGPVDVEYFRLLFYTYESPGVFIPRSADEVEETIADIRTRAPQIYGQPTEVDVEIAFEGGSLHDYVDSIGFLPYTDFFCPTEFSKYIRISLRISELTEEMLSALCHTDYVSHVRIHFPHTEVEDSPVGHPADTAIWGHDILWNLFDRQDDELEFDMVSYVKMNQILVTEHVKEYLRWNPYVADDDVFAVTAYADTLSSEELCALLQEEGYCAVFRTHTVYLFINKQELDKLAQMKELGLKLGVAHKLVYNNSEEETYEA